MRSRPLIYTAQSKQYFYCKEAVCEYVLGNGGIPLNPFQVFGYFLNDRMPRNTIRLANRDLLQRCDEVWVFGDTLADGVLVEIGQAALQGKPTAYFSIDSHAENIVELDPSALRFEHEVLAASGLRDLELLDCLRRGDTAAVVKALGRLRELTLE